MDNNIYRVITNEDNESFRINVLFEECSLNLTILTSKAWKAKVKSSEIRKLADEHQISIDEYCAKLKQYFGQVNKEIQFRLNNNKFGMNLMLKNGMKLVYFLCELEEVDFNGCVLNLVDSLYFERVEMIEKLRSAKEERVQIEKSKNEYERKLNQFIEMKKTDEEELYNNFVTVLNEKKRHIQHLNELLIAFKRGRPTVNPHVEVKRRKTKKEVVKIQTSIKIKEENDAEAGSSSDTYNTDDEKERNLLQSSEDEEQGRNYNEGQSVKQEPNLDLLSEDSPPHISLPKRFKRDNEVSNPNILNEPSTSKQCLETKEKNDEAICTQEVATVNFNTQDLLDNL